MNVWHLTPETPRQPSRVPPSSPVHLHIGTWPIEPGQEVAVEFSVTSWSGRLADGHAHARWVENRGENSYWTATVGPFTDGDRMQYRVVGSVRGEHVLTEWASFTVRPAIHLALFWHHHQPLYRDLTTPPDGGYRFPWVRLHALRDYFGMVYLLSQYPDVHATINFSPILLWQLEDYLERGGSDRALQLIRKRTSYLTSAEWRELLETFFDADWHHQIYPYPRYRALLEQRVQGQRFSIQDVSDLKMWFNLSWFPHELRTGTVILSDGTTLSVQRFIEQGMQFTQRDIEAMLAEQDKLLRSILPLHRQLQEQGQIEVSVSPYGHPILPLLMDTDLATLDRAGTTLPARFAHLEDAEAHMTMAVAQYHEWFGCEPRGMWPAEGAVAEALVSFCIRHGIQWIATDEGVLARSGRYGYQVEDPNVLCQPYQAPNPGGEGVVSVLFRHRQLSDAIGFHYQGLPDPKQAAESLPGVDLGTWVGEPEENAAWELLGAVRRALKEAGARPDPHPDAFRALYAAERSDWFWWFGDDHTSDADEAFDDLFRSHLKAACQLAGITPFPEIDRHIVPHRVIWTFTVPVGDIQADDQLIVRTNCPGTLAWSLDGWQRSIESPLSPVGGAMAGAARYAITLGPFPAGTTLAFRFRCQHRGCAGEDVCCRGQEWTVKIVEKRRA